MQPAGLRLQKLLALTKGTVIPSKEDCILYAAMILMKECKCVIYGGFVRDYLIGGDIGQVKDIDSRSPDTIQNALNILNRVAAKYSFSLSLVGTPRACGKPRFGTVQEIAFRFFGRFTVEADITEITGTPPSVDASVNNIQITADGTLTTKFDKNEDLSVVIQNITRKEFHFYMNWGTGHSYCKFRAEKLLKKGYTCLSGIPPAQIPSIDPNLHHLTRSNKRSTSYNKL
jgi:hypothetical protein